jgi:ligand-binding sensor domain-containing protein
VGLLKRSARILLLGMGFTALVLVGTGLRARGALAQDWHVLGAWHTFANGDDVRAVGQDDASGAVWAGTAGGGVVRWAADGSALRQYLAPQDGLPCNDVRDVVQWRGEWWFATCAGLAVYDPGRDRMEGLALALPSPSVTALAVDEGDRLWVATDQDWDAGLTLPGKTDPGGWTGGGVAWTADGQGWHVLGVGGGLPSSNVRDLVAWRGAVWAATAPYQRWQPPTVDGDGNPVKGHWEQLGGGVARRDGERWVAYDSAGTAELSDSATALAADARALWVGTAGRGLVAYDGTTWKALLDCGDAARCIQDNYVTAVAAGPDGAIWVGTARFNGHGTGLQVLDSGGTPVEPRDDAWHGWQAPDGLPGERVHAIRPRPDGTVWLGAAALDPEGAYHGGGLVRLANDRQSIAAWRSGAVGTGVPGGNDITALARDAAGGLWVGTDGAGVSVRDAAGAWRTYTRASTGGGLGSDAIADIVAEPGGVVWVATRYTTYDASTRAWADGGLSRFENGTWQRLTAANSGLPSDHLSALALDPVRGKLWVGTGATDRGPKEFTYRGWGLAVLDTKTLKWERTYTFPVLTSNNITDLWLNGDTLWVATAYFFYVDSRPGGAQLNTGGGVSALNLATGQWRKYGASEGLTPALRLRGSTGTQALLDVRAIYVNAQGTAYAGGLAYPDNAPVTEARPDAIVDVLQAGRPVATTRLVGAGPVTAIAPDSGGNLWVATARDGARVWVAPDRLIPQTAGASGLPSDALTALGLAGGQVWVGTRDAGVAWLAPPEQGEGVVVPPDSTPVPVLGRLDHTLYLPAVERRTRPDIVVIPPD